MPVGFYFSPFIAEFHPRGTSLVWACWIVLQLDKEEREVGLVVKGLRWRDKRGAPVSRLNGRQLRSVIAAVCREQRAPSTSCSKFHALRPPLLCLAPSSVLPPPPTSCRSSVPREPDCRAQETHIGSPTGLRAPAAASPFPTCSLWRFLLTVGFSFLSFSRGAHSHRQRWPLREQGGLPYVSWLQFSALVCAENKRQVALLRNAFIVTRYNALK